MCHSTTNETSSIPSTPPLASKFIALGDLYGGFIELCVTLLQQYGMPTDQEHDERIGKDGLE